MTTTLSLSEILDALAAASPDLGEDVPPHTYSGTEIQAALRWGHVRFSREMRAWLRDGVCKVVTMRKYAIDGRLATTKAYQFAVPIAKVKRKA